MNQSIVELSLSIAAEVQKAAPFQPDTAIILGSGLGDLTDHLVNRVEISTATIEGYPVSTVEGHAGKIIFGELGGKKVMAFKGRIHVYEGYDSSLTTLPVWLTRHMKAKQLLVTNAAGGINPLFSVGDFMIITDHINLQFRNPLIGSNDNKFGPRFPDMSQPYNKGLIRVAERVALDKKIPVKKGVYLALTGPSYETPAEIRMLKVLGADAVGMSTVMEVIQANHLGIPVLGISLITNLASGLSGQKLSHEEVTETGQTVKHQFIDWIEKIIETI